MPLGDVGTDPDHSGSTIDLFWRILIEVMLPILAISSRSFLSIDEICVGANDSIFKEKCLHDTKFICCIKIWNSTLAVLINHPRDFATMHVAVWVATEKSCKSLSHNNK